MVAPHNANVAAALHHRLLYQEEKAADAAARALRDEVVRAEAKVRKAAGMLRQYKAQTQALEGKVATMASPARAAAEGS